MNIRHWDSDYEHHYIELNDRVQDALAEVEACLVEVTFSQDLMPSAEPGLQAATLELVDAARALESFLAPSR